LLVPFSVLCAGCADPDRPIITSAGDLTQNQADAIAERYAAPQAMLNVEDGDLTIQPGKDLEVFRCVFDELMAMGQTELKRVGNKLHRVPESR